MDLLMILDKKSQDKVVESIQKHSNAYIAYLQIHDANNIRERKELLPIIIEEPKMGLLFLKNCRPSMAEKEFVFKSILHDRESVFQYLAKHSPSEDQIDRALEVILEDYIIAYETAKLEDLNTEQRKRIYDKYRETYTNKLEIAYVDFCLTFKDCITDSEKETMVDLIYKLQDKDLAKLVLNGQINIQQYLKEKLESVLVLARLYRKPMSV